MADAFAGWVSEIDKPAQHDDVLVKILRDQGAIIYCKTNIPQSLMVSIDGLQGSDAVD